jgi:hypothetical protein
LNEKLYKLPNGESNQIEIHEMKLEKEQIALNYLEKLHIDTFSIGDCHYKVADPQETGTE